MSIDTLKADIDFSENSIIGIYGAGGFARELMPLAVRHLSNSKSELRLPRFVFIDDNKQLDVINGHDVLSFDEFLATNCKTRYFSIGVGDSETREKLVEKCISKGVVPVSLVSSSATSYEYNTVGEGAVLCANTVLTSNVTLGRFFQGNIYSYVAHDCEIGDFVTFAPRVSCNGNVHIDDYAYIGTGAVLRQGTAEKPLLIGKGAVVGMGAVVTKDVAPYTTVVGNPARPFEKKA